MQVLIIEKDQTILNNLLFTLRNKQNIEIIFTKQYIDEGTKLLNTKQVDIVIANYLLIENQLVEQDINCLKKYINVKKIIISTIEKNDLYYNVFSIGSVNIISKKDINLISEIIDKVCIDNYYDPIVFEKVREEFIRLKKLEEQFEIERIKSILTSREIEILRLIDQGFTQTEIANELYISICTVKNHVSNILQKMNENNSKEVAKRVKEIGIL